MALGRSPCRGGVIRWLGYMYLSRVMVMIGSVIRLETRDWRAIT